MYVITDQFYMFNRYQGIFLLNESGKILAVLGLVELGTQMIFLLGFLH